MDGASAAGTADVDTSGEPMAERRRDGGGGFLFRLRPAELISVIGLVSGGILWLAHVSSIAGSSATRLEKVEADVVAMRATMEAVKETVTDLRIGIESRGADLRERLAKIEALLAASAGQKEGGR